MTQCTAITASGRRCQKPADGPQGLCWSHHAPENAAARRAMAARAARAKSGSKELAEIKGQLAELYANVLAGGVERGVAAVAAQVANVRLRALELERRHRETDELEQQIAELEARVYEAVS